MPSPGVRRPGNDIGGDNYWQFRTAEIEASHWPNVFCPMCVIFVSSTSQTKGMLGHARRKATRMLIHEHPGLNCSTAGWLSQFTKAFSAPHPSAPRLLLSHGYESRYLTSAGHHCHHSAILLAGGQPSPASVPGPGRCPKLLPPSASRRVPIGR